jgi:hypothetical protein
MDLLRVNGQAGDLPGDSHRAGAVAVTGGEHSLGFGRVRLAPADSVRAREYAYLLF